VPNASEPGTVLSYFIKRATLESGRTEIRMTVEYDHEQNIHTLNGARMAFSHIFSDPPQSILDVGCGTGTWLKAAREFGVPDVFGIDGILVPEDRRHLSGVIKQCDLTVPFQLGRRFDVAMCLEVAEHIPDASAAGLISSITSHSDKVLFGAACPGQYGQHHVNCQWPGYWQELFNRHGFVCEDSIRWKIWNENGIEPWYRQNIFWARLNPQDAGREPRIAPVMHPDMTESMQFGFRKQIESGSLSIGWYATTPLVALARKISRKFV
jgi:SAM-dependent methyltransferase